MASNMITSQEAETELDAHIKDFNWYSYMSPADKLSLRVQIAILMQLERLNYAKSG
jgi:hypothetical protein